MHAVVTACVAVLVVIFYKILSRNQIKNYRSVQSTKKCLDIVETEEDKGYIEKVVKTLLALTQAKGVDLASYDGRSGAFGGGRGLVVTLREGGG